MDKRKDGRYVIGRWNQGTPSSGGMTLSRWMMQYLNGDQHINPKASTLTMYHMIAQRYILPWLLRPAADHFG